MMTMKLRLRDITVTLLTVLLSFNTTLFAQSEQYLPKKHFNTDNAGVAIAGYDAVSYFTKQEPVKGKKEYAVNDDGITYYFATSSNRDLFKANPKKYEPQYGGWCAYAMGEKGEKVEVDPETFKIVDGKLYLFYNRFFNNTLTSWNKNEVKLKTQADKNWDKIFK